MIKKHWCGSLGLKCMEPKDLMDFKMFALWDFFMIGFSIKAECSKRLVNWGFQYILLFSNGIPKLCL